MAIVVNGRQIRDRILDHLPKSGKKISLAAIIVGKNPASLVFVSQKKKIASEIGINFRIYNLNEKIYPQNLKQAVKKAVRENSGVIIQLPLPGKLKNLTQQFLDLIPQKKDPDILSTPAWADFLAEGKILPPVAGAVKEIFRIYKIKVKGKKTAIAGFGRLVGQPVAYWLAKQGAKVEIIDINTENKSVILKKSDIIISGIGRPNIIKSRDIKKGAVVIDAGTSEAKGKISGDVEANASKKARLFSPVPGGIGPITTAMLFKNLLILSGKK